MFGSLLMIALSFKQLNNHIIITYHRPDQQLTISLKAKIEPKDIFLMSHIPEFETTKLDKNAR